MRLALLLTCMLGALTACAGSTPRTASPLPLAPDGTVRALESVSTASGLVYIAGDATAIYVYQEAALGSSAPTPIRQILVSPLGQIALDDAGRPYVSGPDWSIRVFSADASGNAVPVRTYTIPDPHPDAATFTHTIESFGFLNDDTLAVILNRADSATSTHTFGVFHLASRVLDVVSQLPPATVGSAQLAVDGEGDVLILNPEQAQAGAVVRRFRPTHGGFHNDGIVISGASCFEQCAIAASGENALQVNAERYCCSHAKTLTLLPAQFPMARGPQFAFGRGGRLYAASFFRGSEFQVYAAHVPGAQATPLDQFTLLFPSQASSVAVTK